MGTFLRNVRIQYKIALIFFVVLVLMVNLGALSITAINDMRVSSETVTDEFLPRIIATSTLKDSVNFSVLAAYEYIRTGDAKSKKAYDLRVEQVVKAQRELFALSKTEADFDFANSFQEYFNGIETAQQELISAYESKDATATASKLDILNQRRDAFIEFLDTEIQGRVTTDSAAVKQKAQTQLNQTILLVSVAGVIAFVTMTLLFSFVRRSITRPLKQLARVAQNIGEGNFSTVATLESRDELGVLAQSFNAMSKHVQSAQNALADELLKTKKLDKQKTEFLSIAAHQLRTPMSGIKWAVQMVIDGDFGSVGNEAKDQLVKSMENIDRMISLINKLLDVSRLEARDDEFTFSQVNIIKVIHDAEESLFQAADKNNVKLVVVPPEKPLPEVRVDVEKIGMVIYNLIDNAIKYTPKGGQITIGAMVQDDMLRIAIQDTGYGIPASEQARIFTKFFRGSNIQTVQADGSGLGLFMVREIISRHGGTISFKSIENKGTTFIVSLPIAGPTPAHPALRSGVGVDPEMHSSFTELKTPGQSL